jgi:hypothetical protein
LQLNFSHDSCPMKLLKVILCLLYLDCLLLLLLLLMGFRM